MDSLGSLRPNAPDVQPFTPWLNIYSRSDLISFCATRIFPGDPRIRDVEVDSGVPFPDSHGAYLHDDRTYQLIREAWGQLG